ncbi:RNA-guided endonuclease InsQ/TnpB family protein [Acidianus manzaensis]|uniref:Transposase n=1 Tax=Acidianus manzaensis TaxID=282676 RepID=A0A1W6K2C3_9CREN|nr:RNA-guided endonuclease TnpB family protein [Acidianus manzaensis]ARM76678.1 transposase [Acidianus manzaensis]
MKNLRIKTFQPQTQYLHITYIIKNNQEKSKELIKAYTKLLNKGIQYLFKKITIIHVKKTNKILLPKNKNTYKELRKYLINQNNYNLAKHYIDQAIHDTYSILESWKRKYEKKKAKFKPPLVKKGYVRVKTTLRKVEGKSVRITVKPYEYITYSWDKTWFSKRVEDFELTEPIIKEDKVHLVFRKELPTTTPLEVVAFDSNLFSLDGYDGEKFVMVSTKQLYSLKFIMQEKRSRVQSLASKKFRVGRRLLNKYSHRERNRVNDLVHKLANLILSLYNNHVLVFEKLNKEGMFKDGSDSLSRKLSRTVWRKLVGVLRYKAFFYNCRVVEVDPYLTSRSCPRCGWVGSRMVGRTFRCGRCGFALDRQFSASLNIFKRYLKNFNLRMWGFSHPERVSGVIPLMGGRGMSVRDFGELQGSRIEYKIYEIQ